MADNNSKNKVKMVEKKSVVLHPYFDDPKLLQNFKEKFFKLGQNNKRFK